MQKMHLDLVSSIGSMLEVVSQTLKSNKMAKIFLVTEYSSLILADENCCNYLISSSSWTFLQTGNRKGNRDDPLLV